jgi:hypothetical protein
MTDLFRGGKQRPSSTNHGSPSVIRNLFFIPVANWQGKKLAPMFVDIANDPATWGRAIPLAAALRT